MNLLFELGAFIPELALLLLGRDEIRGESLLELLKAGDVAFDLFDPLAFVIQLRDLAIHVPDKLVDLARLRRGAIDDCPAASTP